MAHGTTQLQKCTQNFRGLFCSTPTTHLLPSACCLWPDAAPKQTQNQHRHLSFPYEHTFVASTCSTRDKPAQTERFACLHALVPVNMQAPRLGLYIVFNCARACRKASPHSLHSPCRHMLKQLQLRVRWRSYQRGKEGCRSYRQASPTHQIRQRPWRDPAEAHIINLITCDVL